jgi:protein required for attachment to host cells
MYLDVQPDSSNPKISDHTRDPKSIRMNVNIQPQDRNLIQIIVIDGDSKKLGRPLPTKISPNTKKLMEKQQKNPNGALNTSYRHMDLVNNNTRKIEVKPKPNSGGTRRLFKTKNKTKNKNKNKTKIQRKYRKSKSQKRK